MVSRHANVWEMKLRAGNVYWKVFWHLMDKQTLLFLIWSFFLLLFTNKLFLMIPNNDQNNMSQYLLIETRL